MLRPGERGSVVTEFIILAPVLVGLVYIAMLINDYLEMRQTVHVAARNLAALPLAADADARSQSLQKDFLGSTRNPEAVAATNDKPRVIRDAELVRRFDELFQATAPTAAPSGSPSQDLDVLMLGERHAAAAYGIDLGTWPTAGPQFDITARAKHAFGGDSAVFKTLSAAEGGAMQALLPSLDWLANTSIFFSGYDRAMASQVTLSLPRSAGLMHRAVFELFALSRSGAGASDAEREAQRRLAVSLTGMHYSRPFAAYLPRAEEYEAQFLVGMGLGLTRPSEHSWRATGPFRRTPAQWFQPIEGGFTTNCMFYYMAGDDCRAPSLYFTIVNTVATAGAVADVIQRVFSANSSSLAKEAAKEIAEKATDELVEKVKKRAEDEVRKRALRELYRQIKEGMKGVSNEIRSGVAGPVREAGNKVYDCSQVATGADASTTLDCI